VGEDVGLVVGPSLEGASVGALVDEGLGVGIIVSVGDVVGPGVGGLVGRVVGGGVGAWVRASHCVPK